MSVQTRRELLNDLKELRKLDNEYQNEQRTANFPTLSSLSAGPYQRPLVSSQIITNSQRPAVYSSQIIGGPQFSRPMGNSVVYGAPLQSRAVYAQPQPQVYGSRVLSASGFVNQPVQVQHSTAMRESIKGESHFEYVPYEKVFVEHQEQKVKELVEVKKTKTDYYTVEKQIEYVPYTTYETIQEVVPQQKTTYIEQETVEYVPETRTEMVPVERVEEKVDYETVQRQVIHYPEFDRQFESDALTSGKIITGERALSYSQHLAPRNAAPVFASQIPTISATPIVQSNPLPALSSSQIFPTQFNSFVPQRSILPAQPLNYSSVLPRPATILPQVSIPPVNYGPSHFSSVLPRSQVLPPTQFVSRPPIYNRPITILPPVIYETDYGILGPNPEIQGNLLGPK